jgi:hypothetical protein
VLSEAVAHMVVREEDRRLMEGVKDFVSVGSALNRTYTLYGLGVHYVQAEGGELGITACVACANPV